MAGSEGDRWIAQNLANIQDTLQNGVQQQHEQNRCLSVIAEQLTRIATALEEPINELKREIERQNAQILGLRNTRR